VIELKRIRIVLADDDEAMLATTNKLLQNDCEIVGMVSDGSALVEAALNLHPDVVVTDISMPVMNGIEAVRRIRGAVPGTKFVFLTMHDANGYRREARSAGADGYVLKSSAREELNQAIREAAESAA
jgi:DNA-binding NarL/FixJ family response regulator